ncbi:MAG: zinc ribbon domain-containing protein [Dehalococcoidales bacterium]|nr:zinc ribbon domain-containing protein [Dehalococcoidales bacterium]
MFCPNCGANVPDGSRFCPGCGSAVAAPVCPRCGTSIKAGVNFCPSCGQTLKGAPAAAAPPPAPTPTHAGIASNLKGLAPGEVVLMDTGTFPITYVKNVMSSTNGKLYLTSQRLIFKAGALQGIGGVSSGGLFIPNPKDAGKAKEFFGIPLSEITAVESGWANVTVEATGKKYKFGGMLKTKDWANEINRLIQSR